MEHKVEEVKLKCGAKGLFVDVPGAPVFCMEVWFRAGDAYTPGGSKIETAHAMEHLAFAANKRHPALSEVSRFLSKNGAYKNAHTSRNFLWYRIECPDFDWERLLEYLVMQITTPRFLQEEFDSEMSNIEEEFRGRANNRWAELSDIMDKRFGWDFGETDKERLDLMYNVKLEDVVAHYKKTHHPENANFFIAGDLSKEKDKIKSILEGISALSEGERFTLPDVPEIRAFSSEPVVVQKKEVENVFFALDCYADCKLADGCGIDDISAQLNTLNVILTHDFHSRILGKARKEGLAYHVGSGRSTYHNNSCSWGIYAEIGRDKMDKFIDLVVEELRSIVKSGVNDEEVKEATEAVRGALKMENQTTYKIMSYYRGKYMFGESSEVRGDISELDEQYSKVSRENIQEAFLNLIKTKKWGAGFLGNVSETQAKKWNKKIAEVFED